MLDVDYGDIIKRAWKITKTQKWLWVYGLVLGAFSASSSSGGGGNSNFSGSADRIATSSATADPSRITETFDIIFKTVQQWFSQVPATTWTLLAISFLVSFGIVLVIQWITVNWASGGLITGIDQADKGHDATLANTTIAAKRSVWPLFVLSLIHLIVGLGMGITFAIPLLGGSFLFTIVPTIIKVGLVIVGIFLLLVAIVALIVFTQIDMFAKRLVILKHAEPWAAWKRGLLLSKKHLLPTLLMSFINSAIGCTAGCLTTAVMAPLILIPGFGVASSVLSGSLASVSVISVVGLLGSLILLGVINTFIRALTVVFDESTWTIFFKKITQEENI